MLTKYKLVDTFQGGVDHLIDGTRVAVNEQMTDAQAEVLINAGLKYFEPIKPLETLELDGNPIDPPSPADEAQIGGQVNSEGESSPGEAKAPTSRRKPRTNNPTRYAN